MQQRIGKASLWLTVVMPFAMGFFIGMAFKCINAILAHPLMVELKLSNVEVGWVTSVFLLSFAVMQLPLGVLLDSWGPRKTQTLLFVVGAAGITLFGLSSDVTTLALGQSAIAIGAQSRATTDTALAVGFGATAAHQNAAAYGNGATTTRDNQQVFGTGAALAAGLSMGVF